VELAALCSEPQAEDYAEAGAELLGAQRARPALSEAP
jgi:hypothetical protein